MKIGFFTDYYLPSGAGVTVSIETFRKELEKKGHKVFIFAPASKGFTDKNPNVFRFKALTLSKKRDLYLALPFLPEKKRLQEILKLKLDIIHAQSPFNMGFLGKYIALRQKIPFVYTHHTHLEEYAKFYLKENFFTPSLAKTWTTFFCNFSDLIITPSQKIKNVLRNYGLKKKIVTLPTGVDLEFFKKDDAQKKCFRKKMGLPEKSNILLFVGRMEGEKNPLFIINSLKEVLKEKKEVFLVMVGSGPYEKKAKDFAEDLGIGNFVKITGKIPYQEIPSYYQGSDIFCFASLTETQGLVILEAEAAGLPVVVLKDDAFEGIVRNKINGFVVEKQKPELFAKFILEILNNEKIYDKFSTASQEIAGLFSKEKQAKKIIEIYSDLTTRPKNKNGSRLVRFLSLFSRKNLKKLIK